MEPLKRKAKKANTQTAARMDAYGNKIVVVHKDNIISVFIKLKEEDKRRKIGFININTKTLHVRRKRAIHLFRKYDAYGFCYQLIEDAKKFNQIRLIDDHEEFLIPTSYILDRENIKFLHFLGQGMEKQVFISLENLKQFKRPQRF